MSFYFLVILSNLFESIPKKITEKFLSFPGYNLLIYR